MTFKPKVNNSAARAAKGLARTGRLLGAASVAALMATAISPTGAIAQVDQADTYSGGKSRVNNSAKLRAMTEGMVAASCRLAAGIMPDAASASLTTMQTNYNTILAGLETGSPALGMPGEEKASAALSDPHCRRNLPHRCRNP